MGISIEMRPIYYFLWVIGIIIPMQAFVPWLWEHGLDVSLFFQELLANRISRFFALDLLIAAIATILFILVEGKRLAMEKTWVGIVGCLCIGVSFALPFFLWQREVHLQKTQS